MFYVIYHKDFRDRFGRYEHIHTRKEASLDAAMAFVQKMARKRANPFPITILEKGVVEPVIEFADRETYRKHVRT